MKIDDDIRIYVLKLDGISLGQQVAMEISLQTRRDRGAPRWIRPSV